MSTSFRIFIEKISDGGTLIYFEDDPEVKKIALEAKNNITKKPYKSMGIFRIKPDSMLLP